MTLEGYITIASLLFSVFAFVWATIASKKTRDNEKRLQEFELNAYKALHEEKKKALIDAKVYELEHWWNINVYNRGLATARNIRFSSNEIAFKIEDFGNSGGIMILKDNDQIPYPFLHNGGSFDVRTILAEGHKSIATVRFIWDDDFSNNNERDIVLNF